MCVCVTAEVATERAAGESARHRADDHEQGGGDGERGAEGVEGGEGGGYYWD